MQISRNIHSTKEKTLYGIYMYMYLFISLHVEVKVQVMRYGVCPPQVIVGPEKMIVVPPRHYCVIENPAMKDKDGKPVFDTHGQVYQFNSGVFSR